MIKEYNFPVIFQNVVGEVIPSHILQRRQRFNLGNPCNSDAASLKSSSDARSQLSNRKFLKIKSKKKELQRRSKMMKTMNCFTYRPQNNQQHVSQQTNSPKFVNFLKKKLAGSDIGNNNSNINEADPVKQMSSLQSCEIENDGQLRKNHFRIRTSFDCASIQGSIKMQNDNQLMSQSEGSQPELNRQWQQLQEDYVEQEADQTKDEQFAKEAINDKRMRSAVKKTIKGFEEGGNQMKKKTVNFTIESEQSSLGNEQSRIKFTNKKDSERSGLTSNRSKFPKKEAKFSKQSPKSGESNWSNKSVVSIKFSGGGTGAAKSKRSSRSNKSLLNGQNMWIKISNRKKTGTYRHIGYMGELLSQKNYKTDNDIKSTISIEFKPISQTKNKTSSKKIVSNKSIKWTSKNYIKEIRKFANKVKSKDSLVRSNDNGVYTDICDYSLAASLKDLKFNDSLFKRSTKNLLKRVQIQTQQHNVYGELNNFRKFMNQRETIQSQSDLVCKIAKPIVIQNQNNVRVRRINQNMKNENIMIQMGLQLVRKMNRLAQKKL